MQEQQCNSVEMNEREKKTHTNFTLGYYSFPFQIRTLLYANNFFSLFAILWFPSFFSNCNDGFDNWKARNDIYSNAEFRADTMSNTEKLTTNFSAKMSKQLWPQHSIWGRKKKLVGETKVSCWKSIYDFLISSVFSFRFTSGGVSNRLFFWSFSSIRFVCIYHDYTCTLISFLDNANDRTSAERTKKKRWQNAESVHTIEENEKS